MRWPGAVALAATCLLAPSAARADFDFQLALGSGAAFLRQTPRLTSKAVDTNARSLDEGAVAMRGGLALLGINGDASLTIDDRWQVPILGGGVYWAAGSYDAVVTSLDGSIARVRPWTAYRIDLLLPGLGYRTKHRRHMFAAALRPGVGLLGMDGSVAAANESVPLELRAASFVLQAEIEGCRRLDPTTRVCLQVAPRFYDFGGVNGLTAALRMEWGR